MMSRGWYGDDGKFHDSDASPEMEGYRRATQVSSNNNGRLNRKYFGDGMSKSSALNHKGVTDNFFNGEYITRKKGDAEREVNGSKRDSVSKSSNSYNESPVWKEGEQTFQGS